MDYTTDPTHFDALPAYFVARAGHELYALFEVQAQVLPEEGWRIINVIRPVNVAYRFGTTSMFSPCEVRFRSLVRREADARHRECIYRTLGIEVPIVGGPVSGAQLIEFENQHDDLLPAPLNNLLTPLIIRRDFVARQHPEPIAPMWQPPVRAPPPAPPALLIPLNADFHADPMPAPRRAGAAAWLEYNVHAAPAAAAAPPPPALPAHVKSVLIEAAIAKGESCPISMNPITKENAAVTSCGHVYDRDSIAQWLASSDRNGCAICREHCSV